MEKKLKMHLESVDDLFKNDDEREASKYGKIVNLRIDEIDDFPNHPFKVLENEDLEKLQYSIKEQGVIEPLLVRKKDDGRYELISGHRRKKASNLIGLESIPCIVKDLTNDEAVILMVDSNYKREKTLPSELAFAYKMKRDALKHQGKKLDPTLYPMETKLNSGQILEKESDDSRSQIYRYIRLTHLIPELLQLVDNEEMGITPKMGLRTGSEISFLTKEEQQSLLDYIECYSAVPSPSQAKELKALSKDGKLDEVEFDRIMSQEKPNQIPKISFNEERLRSVLPLNIEQDKVEDFVVRSIKFYSKYLLRKEMAEKDSR